MRRIAGSYPAAGDSFWSGLHDDNEELLTEREAPPSWQVITALLIYGSLIILIGVMLAG